MQLEQLDGLNHAGIEVTDEMVAEVIQSAKDHLEEGEPEGIKLLLRDLIQRVEISEEEVTLRYSFRLPDAKVAQLLAPHAGVPKNL